MLVHVAELPGSNKYFLNTGKVNKINLLPIIILIEIPLVSMSVMCGNALSRANVL